jgi:hypothetical protein
MARVLTAFSRPSTSQILQYRLATCPPSCGYTSFFVHKSAFLDDLSDRHVLTHGDWKVYRASAASYLKLYCTRSGATSGADNDFENKSLGMLKMLNLGVPFFLYGLAAPMLFKSALRVPHAAFLLPEAELQPDQRQSFVTPSAPPRNDAVDLLFFYDVREYERQFSSK